MPDPPSVSLINRYLFDNPWPLSILLVVIAVGLLIAVRNTGRRRYLRAAILAGLLAIGVLIVERLVTTSGEHATETTIRLVEAAAQVDVPAAQRLFSTDATMSLINPQNPGVGIDTIRRRLELLDGRYRMKSNVITSLRAYSVDAGRALVHLRIRSDFESTIGYPVFSSWVLEVQRQPDDQWLISQLTFVEYNKGQKPGSNLF